MSNAISPQANITIEVQYRGILEIALTSAPIAVPCCVFYFINGVMLFTLRSKSVFCETCRYILLYNLLCADTAQMAVSQVLYMLSACRVKLTYPVCGFLTMLANLTALVSPLTLVVMCLERYVAVCFPLRHAAIVTIRNTGMTVTVVWAFISLHVLTQVLLLSSFPFENLESLQMADYCSFFAMLLSPAADHFNKAFAYLVFLSAGAAVTVSYVGVILAARSASADKASAQKACKTLLLHLVQLGLSLTSALHTTLMKAVAKTLDRVTIFRIQSTFYVCLILLPRCLSALIYGIRDRTIRPVLLNHLFCRLKL